MKQQLRQGRRYCSNHGKPSTLAVARVFVLARYVRGMSCGFVELEARRWADSTPCRFLTKYAGCAVAPQHHTTSSKPTNILLYSYGTLQVAAHPHLHTRFTPNMFDCGGSVCSKSRLCAPAQAEADDRAHRILLLLCRFLASDRAIGSLACTHRVRVRSDTPMDNYVLQLMVPVELAMALEPTQPYGVPGTID